MVMSLSCIVCSTPALVAPLSAHMPLCKGKRPDVLFVADYGILAKTRWRASLRPCARPSPSCRCTAACPSRARSVTWSAGLTWWWAPPAVSLTSLSERSWCWTRYENKGGDRRAWEENAFLAWSACFAASAASAVAAVSWLVACKGMVMRASFEGVHCARSLVRHATHTVGL